MGRAHTAALPIVNLRWLHCPASPTKRVQQVRELPAPACPDISSCRGSGRTPGGHCLLRRMDTSVPPLSLTENWIETRVLPLVHN